MQLFKAVKAITGTGAMLLLLGALMSGTDPKLGKDWDAANPLTWKDFRDTAIANPPYKALTGTITKYSMRFTDDKHVEVGISCYMDFSKSWVIATADKTDYLLAHEQYHFNIAEYWHRKLRKEISTTRFDSKSVKEKLRSVYADISRQNHEMEMQYDSETRHSKEKEQQKLWQEKVDKLLNSVKGYAGNEPIIIALK